MRAMTQTKSSTGSAQTLLGDSRLHWEITDKIISCGYAVHKELGPGFLEVVYAKALVYELLGRGLTVSTEQEIPVWYKGRPVGTYFADIVVEDKILLELKAVRAIAPEHQAQLLHYLTATGMRLGLLLNFGAQTLQFKRLIK